MPIGTVCAIDRQPRRLTASQKHGLRLLADFAEDLTHQRSAAMTLQRYLDEDASVQGSRRAINRLSDELLNPLTPITLQTARLRRAGVDPAGLDVIDRSVARLREAIQDAVDHLAT